MTKPFSQGIQLVYHSIFSACISHSDYEIIFLQLEYLLRGKQDFLTSKIKLPSGSSGNGNDVRTKIDPDTQARLEALLEAAGKFSEF